MDFNDGKISILDDGRFRVEAAVIRDAAEHENGELLLCDGHAAIVKLGGWTKCLTDDVARIADYKKRGLITGNVCYLGMPLDAADMFGLKEPPCRSYAYFGLMPPLPDGRYTVKRLAPSLAETVRDAYCGEDGYSVADMEKLMREKGVFGAIVDGRLAGFIGRHFDGSMGMLHIFEPFRRRGLGYTLEAFLISYITTFLRVPHCDVYIDNAPSLALQQKLGLTPSNGYTFWVPDKE